MLADESKELLMTTKTIEYIHPSPRRWDGGQVPIFFVEVNFEDGSLGSVGTTEQFLQPTIDALTALKDIPSDFELEDKGEFKGTKQWKIKGYPGKPGGQGSGGGGGGGKGGGGMSHAQAGLMAAASYLGPVHAAAKIDYDGPTAASNIIELAEALTEHLFTRRKEETPAEDKPAATDTTPAAQMITLAQMKALREIIKDKGWSDADVEANTGVKKLADLTSEDAEVLLESWQ